MTPTEIHNIWLHMSGKSEGIMEAGGESDFPVLFATAILQYDRMERGADNLDRMSKPNKRPLPEEWIEQAEKQEPVAWITHESKWRLTGGGNAGGTVPVHAKQSNTAKYPLYTTPQPQPQPCPYIRSTREGTHHCALSQREWVGLTLEEIDLLEELYAPPVHPDFVNDASHCLELIRHVEAKLKEKNA